MTHNTFAILGTKHGDSYNIREDCLATLEDILRKLCAEDQTLRTFRRAIGFGQNIRRDLVPLLVYAKNDPQAVDLTRIIDTTVKILVNLTAPVECLLPIEAVSRTDVGRHTIFELDRLLTTSKEAFADFRLTKAVMDHMKCVVEQDSNLNVQQCDSINNCLLLLRNVLHIPDNRPGNINYNHNSSAMDGDSSNGANNGTNQSAGGQGNGQGNGGSNGIGGNAFTSLQNEIIWNLFTQSFDKMIIYLLSCPQKAYWSVTSVQLIALLYKDQHVGTLQKLLNLWLEATLSESSEDNESNTSPPPDQNGRSGDSSPVITSDRTSDSSDNGGGNGAADCADAGETEENGTTMAMGGGIMRSGVVQCRSAKAAALAGMKRVQSTETETSNSSSGVSSMVQSNGSESDNKSCTTNTIEPMVTLTTVDHSQATNTPSNYNLPLSDKTSVDTTLKPPSNTTKQLSSSTSLLQKQKTISQSEATSDCGYGTQVENQESISTSSNDDDQPQQKPVHQKPHTFHQKSRYNAQKGRVTTPLEKKELRRKKLVRRSKTHIINMKGLMHHTPTDEDISNILKEFTVDFLLKGYGPLVHDLHEQLLTNIHMPIDTSHFFWLVTYFLKFATQLELELEHVSMVLCYDILSYLIFQSVWLHEDLEVSRNIPGVDLKPCLRRLHLVVTAIREFLQAVQCYHKLTHLSADDRKSISILQNQINEADNLKSIFLLLLRQYNPKLQSRQYLQDLIVTNHNYLLLVDSNNTNKSVEMMEHIKQFATVEVMCKYGLLLEGFKENGEFVNNCVFTMMHHIGGDLENVSTLFQPSILKTFSQIWETEYEICDDWSDLIEYVIHKFINTPRSNHCSSISTPGSPVLENMATPAISARNSGNNQWTQDEKENLFNYYTESCTNSAINGGDTVATIARRYEEQNTTVGGSSRLKTHAIILSELLQQRIISQAQFDEFQQRPQREIVGKVEAMEEDEDESDKSLVHGDITVLKKQLYKENKGRLILWLQNVLIEACFAKLVLMNPDEFKQSLFLAEPVVYYYALLHLPIPVVPWTFEQSNVFKHEPFILLLHKLGFHLPMDTGKIFARIPDFWAPSQLFSIAQQLGPIDSDKLKFDKNLLDGKHKPDENMSTNCVEIEPFDSEQDLSHSTCTLGKTTKDHKPNQYCKMAKIYNNSQRHVKSTRFTSRLDRPLLPKLVPTFIMSQPSTLTKPFHLNNLPLNFGHQLSIKIPVVESLPALISPPPRLSIASHTAALRNPYSTRRRLSAPAAVLEGVALQVQRMDISSSADSDEEQDRSREVDSRRNLTAGKSRDVIEEEEGEEVDKLIEKGEDYEEEEDETASVASDLTRMCVSDEEDKLVFIGET